MGSLYDILEKLCAEKGVKGYRMCVDVGLSRSFMTELRKGRTKSANADTVKKLANYFGVPVDYIMNEASAKELSPYDERKRREQELIEMDDIYLRLAKEAHDLKLDEQDIDTILSIYKKHREKNR